MSIQKKAVGLSVLLFLLGSFAASAGDRCLINVDGWDPGGHVVVTVDFDDGTGPASATLVDELYSFPAPASDASLAQLVWTYANSVDGWSARAIGSTTVVIWSASGAELLGCDMSISWPASPHATGVFDLPFSVIEFDAWFHDFQVVEPAVSSGGPIDFEIDGTVLTLAGAQILGQPDEAVRSVALDEIQVTLPTIAATAFGNTAIVLESADVSDCGSSDAEILVGCDYLTAIGSVQAPALSSVAQAVLIGLVLTAMTVLWYLRAGRWST